MYFFKMVESEEHKQMKMKIAGFLAKEGYKVIVEYKKGRSSYDVAYWNSKNEVRVIELFMYLPRLDWQQPNITCRNCNYAWHTISKAVYVSCPSCLSKNKVKVLKDGRQIKTNI